MKPDKEGVWGWFDADGKKQFLYVWNVLTELNAFNGLNEVCLCVAFNGFHFTINDEIVEGFLEKAQWTDRWGNYKGTIEEFGQDKVLFYGDIKL